MAPVRARAVHTCGACGHEAPRWHGRCPACGEWGTLSEQGAPSRSASRLTTAARGQAPEVVRLADLRDTVLERLPTGQPELDRVLGGGLVAGSLVLVGGEPGIGKSTLVLQALAHLARSGRALLVTGEESPQQVRARAERLEADCDGIEVLADTSLESVIAAIEATRPAVCAVDSVQTLHSDAIEGPPGSVSQVREVTGRLMRLAKRDGVAILLVGQVTKDGGLAGPRLLEHLVDAVITFEGDDLRAHRVLRAQKNRFGSTDETGVFEMRSTGLVSVDDPTRLYLDASGPAVGSCVFPAVQGTRALLVEVQALVGPTEIVPPRRVAVGVDRTRLAQVLAVLARHARVQLGDSDVFVSVAGGARAVDPAADLAIALAVVSAHRGIPLGARTAAFGELGLTGAVRPAGHGARRLAAAATHGMQVAVTPPSASAEEAHGARPGEVRPAGDVRDAIEAAFTAPRSPSRGSPLLAAAAPRRAES